MSLGPGRPVFADARTSAQRAESSAAYWRDRLGREWEQRCRGCNRTRINVSEDVISAEDKELLGFDEAAPRCIYCLLVPDTSASPLPSWICTAQAAAALALRRTSSSSSSRTTTSRLAKLDDYNNDGEDADDAEVEAEADVEEEFELDMDGQVFDDDDQEVVDEDEEAKKDAEVLDG